jgi:hypothetical protein
MKQRIQNNMLCVFFLSLLLFPRFGHALEWTQENWKSADQHTRVALLIHHDDSLYPDSINNVSVLESTLSYLEFSVFVLSNPQHQDLDMALQLFVDRPTEVSLLYYSGPGYAERGTNYIYAKDEQWVSTSPVMEIAPQGNRLVFLDAQRMVIKEKRSGWGAPSSVSGNILVSLGTAPTMTYTRVPRYISTFVEELNIMLPRMGYSVVEILENAHRSIKKKTNNEQLPTLIGSFAEPMYLFSGVQKVRDLNIDVQRISVHPFTMGCTSIHERICPDDERPAHQVSLKRNFWMMTSEVTQKQYSDILLNNPSAHLGDDLPVEKVSWRDAVLFANRLSEKEGRERCYELVYNQVVWSNPHCSGWRLPTEEEWEYAARARSPYLFSGGDYLSEVAWFASNSQRQTQPVCSKKRNDFGLCDMSGNVLEWVFNYYSPYLSEGESSPLRVLRGGSWYYSASAFRVSKRFSLSEQSRCDDCGFRLVRY